MSKHVEPSVNETAFNCPHCGALTTQYWHRIYAKGLSEENPLVFIPKESDKKRFAESSELIKEAKDLLLPWVDQMLSGLVFLQEARDSEYLKLEVHNLYLSKCFNCQKIAVWVNDRLLFPRTKTGVQPNSDLPEGIVRDFEEAREITDASPRGAAALLRLCIQKLCKHLGEKGRTLDEDIGSLVKKGLDPLIQKSLDVVRVIGNEAVHPGVIDLNDDRDTAIQLFTLVNSIAEQMISHPKAVKALYEKLPEAKRKAIEQRDGKNTESGSK
jgi:hypothetical protein